MPRSHAFLFADLCGFTEFTHVHGDERGAELALGFHARVRELAADERCEVVKSIGDAVMLRADGCEAALRIGSALIALGEREGHPAVRVGVDVGPAVEHEGDWFGSTVNTAARVTATARPGELVVTERARAAAGELRSVRLRGRGHSHLKGLPRMQLHTAAAA